MQGTKKNDRPGATPGRIACLRRGMRFAVFVVFGAALAAAQQGRQGSQQQTSESSAAPDPGPSRPSTSPSQLADFDAQSGTKLDGVNAERKKQISDDSARLLKLATDLKAEVDKTTKDTLSISVIRKADAIEKLARNVREKMRFTTGTN